jgi:hypothetical protein
MWRIAECHLPHFVTNVLRTKLVVCCLLPVCLDVSRWTASVESRCRRECVGRAFSSWYSLSWCSDCGLLAGRTAKQHDVTSQQTALLTLTVHYLVFMLNSSHDRPYFPSDLFARVLSTENSASFLFSSTQTNDQPTAWWPYSFVCTSYSTTNTAAVPVTWKQHLCKPQDSVTPSATCCRRY